MFSCNIIGNMTSNREQSTMSIMRTEIWTSSECGAGCWKRDRERERARVVNDSSLNDTVCHTTEIINHLKASPSSNVIPSITALAVTTITTEHHHKKKYKTSH